MDDIQRLTKQELLTMAALLRCMIRLDGRFSEGEREGLRRVAMMVAETDNASEGDAYRTSAESSEPIGEERLWELMEQAGRELADDEAIRDAALAIERQEARETIYGIMFEIAAADVALVHEPKLLDWLTGAWNLPVEAVQ